MRERYGETERVRWKEKRDKERERARERDKDKWYRKTEREMQRQFCILKAIIGKIN